ncbi:electron transport complex subunit RsxC [Anoxynatronum buryatiense]|uniref:Ion-translocating oxidoreductase complex subunit C n=1 Tax=Anoxynatronum buryatiense TaxID=489973 RepID=A0AA46AI36_9CLOT|nr:electron transport complex subunit RsxC [Anoxynatronum buryatiense]SMP45377.1 electron transport complex protein RnfC [Anoxynatronum buryatiense]
MEMKSFKGGAHVPHFKRYTDRVQIQPMSVPERVTIPMHQCLGAPCEPLVKAGDRVSVGQIIGDSGEMISAPVHASVNGVVEKVETLAYCSGDVAKSVIIKTEGENHSFEPSVKRDPGAMSKEEIIQAIRDAGIVGMGGASFPTHVNVNTRQPVDYLVLNGAECEPFLTCDHRAMVERADELVAGAEILSRVIGAKKCLIGIEVNKPDALETLKEKTKDNELFEIVPLAVKYPQGFKSILIKSATGRDVRRGARSAEIGCIVRNVGTTIAVYEAVVYGKPLIERVITVSGPQVPHPGNFLTKIGTPVGHMLAHCGVTTYDDMKVILGGPMTGRAQDTLEAPVIKNSTGVLMLPVEMVREHAPHEHCVRCGKCVARCPMRLYPNQLSIFAETENYEGLEAWNIMDCMECGICVFSCPSNRPILEFIRHAKPVVKKMELVRKQAQ